MKFRPLAPLLLGAALLSGCESIPLPFGNSQSQSAAVRAPKPPSQSPDAQERDTRVISSEAGMSQELDWLPTLESPLEQMEAFYSGLKTQTQRTRTLSNIAYLYDAQLFMLFQDMLDFLPADAQQRELQEQHQWLDQRRRQTTRAFLKHEDEQRARQAAGQAFIGATKTRIEEIENKRKLVVLQ